MAALLANAGQGLGHAFFDQNFQEVTKVIDTNITGTLALIHRVGNEMRARGQGQRHGIEFVPSDRLTVQGESGATLQLRIARRMKSWRLLIAKASQRVSSDMYPRCN